MKLQKSAFRGGILNDVAEVRRSGKRNHGMQDSVFRLKLQQYGGEGGFRGLVRSQSRVCFLLSAACRGRPHQTLWWARATRCGSILKRMTPAAPWASGCPTKVRVPPASRKAVCVVHLLSHSDLLLKLVSCQKKRAESPTDDTFRTKLLAKQHQSTDELYAHYVFTLIVSGLKALSANETAELIP